jgi:hypothetical protein
MKEILNILFTRIKGADDLAKFPSWRVGLSSAAAWSWGVSCAATFGFMQNVGLGPTLIWIIGNIFAIPIFGFLLTYMPISRRWPEFYIIWQRFRLLVLLFLFMEINCILLNMQSILNGFGSGKDIANYEFVSMDKGPYVVLLVGLATVWYIHKGGLKWSVITDVWEYFGQVTMIMLLALFGVLISHGVINEKLQMVVVSNEMNGWNWAYFGFFGIIVGAMSTGHHWQRFMAVKEEKILKVSLWAGFFFGIYMFFVFIAGLFFVKNFWLGLIFMILILCLATSSINSALAALQYISRMFGISKEYIATFFGLAIVLIWPYAKEIGLIGLLTYMYKVRMTVIAVFFFCSLASLIIIKMKKRSIVE